MRNLAYRIGMGRFDHGIDEGRNLHDAARELIGDEAFFDGDLDLPLHIITLSKHWEALDGILYSALGEELDSSDFDDWGRGDEDA